MPRYRFNVLNGTHISDAIGIDLVDHSAARIEAVRYSGEILKEDPGAFWLNHEWCIEVMDDTSAVLFSVHIATVNVSDLDGCRTKKG